MEGTDSLNRKPLDTGVSKTLAIVLFQFHRINLIILHISQLLFHENLTVVKCISARQKKKSQQEQREQ